MVDFADSAACFCGLFRYSIESEIVEDPAQTARSERRGRDLPEPVSPNRYAPAIVEGAPTDFSHCSSNMKTSCEITEFIRNLEDSVDGIAPGSLAPDTVLDSLAVWDSLALLSVLAMMDTEFDRQVTGSDVKACKTVEDLHRLLADNKF